MEQGQHVPRKVGKSDSQRFDIHFADGARLAWVVANVALAHRRRSASQLLPHGATVTTIGFTLEPATNPVPPALWTTNSTEPTIIDRQNTVTNLISSAQQYYRPAQ